MPTAGEAVVTVIISFILFFLISCVTKDLPSLREKLEVAFGGVLLYIVMYIFARLSDYMEDRKKPVNIIEGKSSSTISDTSSPKLSLVAIIAMISDVNQGSLEAIINDQVLKRGDMIEGYLLKDVKKSYVILKKDGKNFKLKVKNKGVK